MRIFDSAVFQALITGAFGFLTAWITIKYKEQNALKKSEIKPKDRMETIFDGYENLIRQQQDDIKRKQDSINQMQTIHDAQQKLIDQLREELSKTQERSLELERELERMKRNYQQEKSTT